MTIQQRHEITFDTPDTIITATISKPNEIVMLTSSGNVIRFNLAEQKGEHLFSVKSGIQYSDRGFDLSAKSSIYTLDEIVVIVNDYKCHGLIHYPGQYRVLNLYREDYHADITCYPIALFKNQNNIPHIIYSVAWNHIQIMNLDTRQILTAAKSLIEENAEERHIEFHKIHKDENKLPWPSPYDYFYGQLKLSPDKKYFLSAGWVWGSFDAYNIYNIDHFIQSNRISDIRTSGWEHESRGVCWINNELIAIVYNPFTEGDDDSNKETPHEIHFYQLINGKTELTTKIKVAGIELTKYEISFNKELNSIVAFSYRGGIAVISLEGKVLFQDAEFKVNNYNADINQFITIKERTVLISRLAE